MFVEETLYSIGENAETGRYACVDCGKILELDTETRLPPCPMFRSTKHHLKAWVRLECTWSQQRLQRS